MTTRTDHGFRMGAAEIIAVAEINGYAIVWVQTATTRRELQITPAGRIIKVSGPLPPVLRGDPVADCGATAAAEDRHHAVAGTFGHVCNVTGPHKAHHCRCGTGWPL